MLISCTASLTEEVLVAKEAATHDWMFCVRDWKRQYLKIMRAVTQINSCYGMFMLVYVSSSFVTAINGAFIILTGLRPGGQVIMYHAVYNWVSDLAFLLAIFYAPHKLRNEVVPYAAR